MYTLRCLVVIALAVVSLLGGCASSLPAYPPMSDAAALETIAARQAMVNSLSAQCDLDLTDAQGQRVSLDGVLVAEPPGRLRVRAWKFGQAVFDLTLADGKAWVLTPDDEPAAAHHMDVSKLPAKNIRDALDLLGPTYFRVAAAVGAQPANAKPGVLVVRGSALGRDDVTCEIDRATLTPRRFVVGGGPAGQPAASQLLLDEYEVVNTIAWPMRMTLQSPTGEVLVRIRELEINGEIPGGAFVPPARAKALP